jgi:hypothetical protein
MLSYTIDDPIADPASAVVEVTVDFGGGHKRWCFFATPGALAVCGDWVEGTRVRVHLGVPHMIIVSELSAGIIDRVLSQMYDQGELEAHTAPLSKAEDA